MTRLARPFFAPLLTAAFLACEGGSAEDPDVLAVRDTLADGVVRVRYEALPDTVHRRVEIDLRIGTLDGDPPYVFGDVRGIDADADGTIYVLDYQAAEIRTFGPDGQYRRTIAGEGGGPGELSEANGMILQGDSLLWVQDHSHGAFLALRTDGTEVRRVPMHVRNYSYIWNGTADDLGRFWKPTSHSDEPGGMPEEGLGETLARSYLVRFDPSTEVKDSIFLGERAYRYHVTHRGNGWSSRGVPYQPNPITIVNPSGGLWMTDGSAYGFVRLDDVGDTLMIIEADVPPPPVTAADREALVSSILERGEEFRRAAEAVSDALPETKPAISGLVVDDEGRLWVRRGEDERQEPRFDVFAADGTFEMAVRLEFRPGPYLPIRIRDGRVYALVRDELDVPYVVRASIDSPETMP